MEELYYQVLADVETAKDVCTRLYYSGDMSSESLTALLTGMDTVVDSLTNYMARTQAESQE